MGRNYYLNEGHLKVQTFAAESGAVMPLTESEPGKRFVMISAGRDFLTLEIGDAAKVMRAIQAAISNEAPGL